MTRHDMIQPLETKKHPTFGLNLAIKRLIQILLERPIVDILIYTLLGELKKY